nr:hypothetical protein [uncultured Holophaga sp.]
MSGYPSDLTLRAKLCPRNTVGAIGTSQATTMSLTTASRFYKPYPPGNVKLNSLAYASWPASTSGDVTLSWTNRNRLTQGIGGQLLAQDDATAATPEGTLKVEVLIGGTTKRTWTGLTGTSQVYTLAQRTADDSDLTKTVQFRITPINGSYTGTVRTTPGFVMG